jgi:hypothetical protein
MQPMSAYFSFFRQVLWLTMWCLLFVVNGGQVVAQSSPLYADQSYLYTPVRLSHGDRERTVRALIDTGCSFCVIDSTFAVDSCGWDRAALAPLHTWAASGVRVPVHTGMLGRVDFCGMTFIGVKCLVIDLKGKLLTYAPNFIIGENLLSAQPLCFDAPNGCLTLGDSLGENAKVLRWQTRESRDGTFTKGIFLKGRVGGKKVRIFLDSGSRYNKVNAALLPDTPRETMELPQADISRRLEVQQVPVCRDVETRVGDYTARLNFVLTDRPDAVLNLDFLRNTIFVLDYDRREIRIKQ